MVLQSHGITTLDKKQESTEIQFSEHAKNQHISTKSNALTAHPCQLP